MKKGRETSFQINFRNSHMRDLNSRIVKSWLWLNLAGCHNASFKELLITILSVINNWRLSFSRNFWLSKESP